MSVLSPIQIRRVNRVRARMERSDPTEAVLDDVFVLWRAFESTYPWPRSRTLAENARIAISTAIDHVGFDRLAQTRRLVDRLKYFDDVSDPQLAEWLHNDVSDARDDPAVTRRRINTLVAAIQPPERWNQSLSRSLADVLYRLRCAVIHPRIGTDSGIAERVFPALREAMIELNIARAAQVATVDIDAAQAGFDVKQHG